MEILRVKNYLRRKSAGGENQYLFQGLKKLLGMRENEERIFINGSTSFWQRAAGQALDFKVKMKGVLGRYARNK